MLLEKNVRIFELNPAGECFEFKSFAIGAKSQSSKTYIEKHVGEFEGLGMDEMIVHGLKAIGAGYKDEKEPMSGKNVEVYTLERGQPFSLVAPEVVQTYIDGLSPNRIQEEN